MTEEARRVVRSLRTSPPFTVEEAEVALEKSDWTPELEKARLELCGRLLDHRSRLRNRISFPRDGKTQRLAADLQEAEAALTILGELVAGNTRKDPCSKLLPDEAW